MFSPDSTFGFVAHQISETAKIQNLKLKRSPRKGSDGLHGGWASTGHNVNRKKVAIPYTRGNQQEAIPLNTHSMFLG